MDGDRRKISGVRMNRINAVLKRNTKPEVSVYSSGSVGPFGCLFSETGSI